MQRIIMILLAASLVLYGSTRLAFAHCDTMDGPVIADARTAFETGTVERVLKWVQPADEKAIRTLFMKVMNVRGLGATAKEIAEQYFYDTLVRVHRAGEGVPFTGVLPAGTPIDPRVRAADEALASGNLDRLEGMVPREKGARLRELFRTALRLRDFDVHDLQAGRAFVRAYVEFFHFAEGGAGHHGHEGHAGHLWVLIPALLAFLFLVVSLVLGILHVRLRRKRDL